MKKTIYASNPRNGNYAGIEITDYGNGFMVATMEQDRGVTPAQALKALKKETDLNWKEQYNKINQKYYYTFETC